MNTARPFLPEDTRADRSLVRAIVAQVLAELRAATFGGESPQEIARTAWPQDRALHNLLTRASVDPATTTGWGAGVAGSTAVASFITSLRPSSAAARLMGAGTALDLAGSNTISVPYSLSTNLTPSWVAEGDAKPVGQDVVGGVSLGPARDLALIVTASERLAQYSAANVEVALGSVLRSAAAWQLDTALFGSTAAGAQPAGLLNGVSVTASASGTGVTGMLGDITLLVDALITAGLGASPMLFMRPSRAIKAKALAGGADLGVPIIPAPTLAASSRSTSPAFFTRLTPSRASRCRAKVRCTCPTRRKPSVFQVAQHCQSAVCGRRTALPCCSN